MKKQQILDFLETVAEIQPKKPAKSPEHRLDATHTNDVVIDGEWVTINQKNNPSLGVKIIKLKDRHAVCELGCGDIVTNQVIESRICFHPESHWRTRCMNCGCYPTPDGKGFVQGSNGIAAAYRAWLLEKKK